MALYQAAASKKEISSSAMEDSESRPVPGGLASMKKQFEKEQSASSHSTFQCQYQQHSSVKQEVSSSSEVTVHSSSQGMELTDHTAPSAALDTTLESGGEVSVHEHSAHESKSSSNFYEVLDGSGLENNVVDGEIPKISTHVLKEQFEKVAKDKLLQSEGEMGTPVKSTKMQIDYEGFEWPPVSSAATGLASRMHENITTRKTESASAAASSRSSNFGSSEDFPPPPPDVLQTASEIADFTQSPEPCHSPERRPEPSHSPERRPIPREVYSKQRNVNELKRLYRHIHPEVRKNIEQDYFSEVSGIVSEQADMHETISGDVQQARYVFENSDYSPQKCTSPEREYLEWDEILKGEVQSMRWVFENQPLDTIREDSPDQSIGKSIPEQEIIAGGDVKYTTWMFETQPIDALGICTPDSSETTVKVPDLARGDVRTATWLFETQALDAMNQMYREDTVDGTCTKDIASGDVKNVRYLFETKHHDTLKKLYSVDEVNLLQLRSECEEIKGDVKKTVKLFETEPLYVIRDSSGQVLEIKTVRREDIAKGDVRTARWLFETQPLDMISHDSSEVKVVRGISMEANMKGGVSKAKWVFETQPLDSIKEEEEMHVIEKETIEGTDVLHTRWLFETQQVGGHKDDDTECVQSEEIIGGDVSTTKYLFENVPMDALKDTVEVGKLQKVVATEEERGDVRHQRWVFETKPLEQIREENKEYIKTVAVEEIGKGDINSCKQIFETIDLRRSDQEGKIQVEGIPKGAVEINKTLFESMPLYAIQDSIGQYHEVKTIRQEEVLRGDVRTCKWMFETKPIDQFDESIQNFQIIKGISAEQIQSGDVKTGKWLFETQPLSSIAYLNSTEENIKKETISDIMKGDVKMCKWLFETQPMEDLYDKDEQITNIEEIHKGDVRTCTWLFESQPLDAIGDQSEKTIKLHTVDREDIQGRDVQTACFLFETKRLDDIQGEERTDYKRVVEMDIQSGDVSTMKYIFENQSLDSISSSKEETMKKIKTVHDEDIQKGNVLNCRWHFENKSIDDFKDHESGTLAHTVTDVTGGNVKKGCFIFETFSLDQIKDASSESSSLKPVSEEEITKGDVKNYTMLFETQPFYAIQDKEGFYHEVTTMKKEEVVQGDVRGTRWLFETKPLDAINESDKVYLIKAVTQEDTQRGDVSSVRWRFETQSLDKISEDEKVSSQRMDILGGDVKGGKALFESESIDNRQSVRTVSVSEIQRGNVKTSTWLFETHTIDELRGQESEYENLKTVTKEEIQKGDVQQAVWLFETHPLGSLREKDDDSSIQISKEEIPQADVKTTTWLFETTPLHEFNDTNIEKQEITGKSIKETLKELYSRNVVDSHGIIIEANEIGDVRMAKYQLMNQESPEIQREEIIRGDLQNIMMNLLSRRDSAERAVLINEEEKGNVNSAKYNLLNRSTEMNVEKEEIVRGDIVQATKSLFSNDSSVKRGILIQENERGDIKMTVYSLLKQNNDNNTLREEVVGGDVKRTIHSLHYSAMDNHKSKRVRIDDSERGNVQFFTTCIEAGALDYLKLIQTGSEEILESKGQEEVEEIIGGDVEGTKLQLKKHQFLIERTVNEEDIIPGDVNSTVKIFMTEPQDTSTEIYKEEIVRGDLKATLNSLTKAAHQTASAVEKEEIIKADISATLKSLEESTHQLRETEKPDVIPGDVQWAIESLEKAASTKTEALREEVMHADIEATKKSLKEAQKSIKDVTREEIVKGDVPTTMQILLESASENKTVQHQASTSGDIKTTIQTLFEPYLFTNQHRASVEGNVPDTVKSLLESTTEVHVEQELIPKSNKQSTIKMFSDREVQHNHVGNYGKTVKSASDRQQKKAGKTVVSEDKSAVKIQTQREDGHLQEQHVDKHSISGTVKREMKTKMSDICAVSKSQSKTIVTTEKTVSEKQHVYNVLKEERGDSVLQKQKGGRQTEAWSTNLSDSKLKSEQQPINIKHSYTAQLIGQSDKKLTQEETKHTQHYQEVIEHQKVDIQPVTSVSLTLDNRLKTIQDLTVQKGHSAVNKAESSKITDTFAQRKASTKNIVGNPKGKTMKGDMQVTMKKTATTHIGNPGPLPPTLPTSTPMIPSSAELPLPPPPPPVMIAVDRQSYSPLPPPPPPICKTKTEFDNFPPPPPPVADAASSEMVVSLPPPPHLLPPTFQQKEYHSQSVQSSMKLQSTEHEPMTKPKKIPHVKKVQIDDRSTQSGKKQASIQSSTTQSSVSMQYTDTESVKSTSVSEAITGLVNAMTHTNKQDRAHTDIKKQDKVAMDEKFTRPLMKPLQEIPYVQRKGVIPVMIAPPSPTPPAKPTPYARKFKTPLMIAEEKYRLQREELEKLKGTGNDMSSNEEQTSQVQLETTLGASSVTSSTKGDSNNLQRSVLSEASQRTSCSSKTEVNSQTDTYEIKMQKSAEELITTTNQQPKSAVELPVKQAVVQDVRHLEHAKLMSQKEDSRDEFSSYSQEKHSSNVEQKRAIDSPKFNVKVVKVSSTVQSMPELKKDLERLPTEMGRSSQIMEKNISVKSTTGTMSTAISQEHRIQEAHHVKAIEKDLKKDKFVKQKEMSANLTQDSNQSKKKVVRETGTRNVQVHHDIGLKSQVKGKSQMSAQQQEHAVHSKKEQKSDRSMEKIVKQGEIKVSQDSQVHMDQQVKSGVPDAPLQHSKLAQQHKTLLEVSTKGKERKEETKTEISQKVHHETQSQSLQQMEQSVTEIKVQQTKLPQMQKPRLEKSVQDTNVKEAHALHKTKDIKKAVTESIGLDSQILVSQQMQHRKEQLISPPPQLRDSHEKSPVVMNVKQERVDHKVTDVKQTPLNKPSITPAKVQMFEARGSVEILEYLRKREELQHILSRIKELEAEPHQINTVTYQTFMNIVPLWLVDQDGRKILEKASAGNNSEEMKKAMIFIRERAMETYHSYETALHNAMSSVSVKTKHDSNFHQEITKKISHISAVSQKRNLQQKQDSLEENDLCNEVKQISSQIGSRDSRLTSPFLRMRSPSPTYITIESYARRADSPLKKVSSSSPGPVPPPPRRSTSPTPKVARSSPSPTRNRTEQLAKLKHTTAKLSRGATPPPRTVTPTSVPIIEKKAEIIQSPATLRRQLKIETSVSTAAVSESETTAGTLKDVKNVHEEVKKVEQKKTFGSKETIDIPVQLGPTTDRMGLGSVRDVPIIDRPGLTYQFESTDRQVYVRNEPTAEIIISSHRDEVDKTAGMVEVVPTFDFSSARSIFEKSNQNKAERHEKHKVMKGDFGMASGDQVQRKEISRGSPWRQGKDPKDEKHLQQKPVVKKHSDREQSSEAALLSEHLTDRVGAFEMSGSRTSSSAAGSFDNVRPGFEFRRAPPTYEDVISGHSLDISAAESPEELLRNFQKTWQESERVFKSLGYTVSDVSESETRSSYLQQASSFVTENSTSGTGSMYSVSKDSLSNGVLGGRQADLP